MEKNNRAYVSLCMLFCGIAFWLSKKIRDTVSKHEVYTVPSIEDGRAASKSPQKFGHFLS
jgi:hypothetical protein